MGGWYTIGVCLGLGLGIGLILSGILASTTVGVGAAAIVGTAAGVGVGLLIGDVPEAVAGGIAGFLGAISAAAVVYGAFAAARRGSGWRRTSLRSEPSSASSRSCPSSGTWPS